MPTLKYKDASFDCTTAIKGSDYIHLLDENGVLVGSFDGISDFSDYTLEDGSYTSPTADHQCYLAVIRDDGTIGKGGHKCNNVSRVATGTYTGTGTAGESSAHNVINIGFAARFVVIQGAYDAWRGPTIFVRGCSRAIFRNPIKGSLGFAELALTWTDTELEWYAHQVYKYSTYGNENPTGVNPIGAENQLNYSGTVYRWIAFG